MSEVLVVGAGISGLAAAWRLRCAGISTCVLERSDRPGGRMRSVQVNECTMEAGANFITDAYRIIPGLAGEMGIPLQAVCRDSAIAIDEAIRAFRADRPATAIKAGILSLRTVIGGLPGLARFAARYRRRGTVDPLDWLDLDPVPTTEWSQALRIATLAERCWRPAYHGFYFQDTHATSAAAVAAMAQHGLRQQTLTMPGGLSSLTDALAARLDVRTGVKVTQVEEGSTSVTVHTDTGRFRADRVIVALPSPDIRHLKKLDPLEAAVACTPYSAGLLVGLGTRRRLRSCELGGAYGVLMHPDEPPLAALCVASRAGHAHGAGDLVTCMFADRHARELSSRADSEIIELARRALLTWEPTLQDALATSLEHHLVVRIPHAMPTSAPGRIAHIKAYRAHAHARRVILAGDSLAWPWADSAAFTGQWAADLIARP